MTGSEKCRKWSSSGLLRDTQSHGQCHSQSQLFLSEFTHNMSKIIHPNNCKNHLQVYTLRHKSSIILDNYRQIADLRPTDLVQTICLTPGRLH